MPVLGMDGIDSVIGFSYVERDQEGREVAKVLRKVHGADGQTLTNLLQEMLYFIQAMGFTYVETLVATKTHGGEVVSR